MKSQEQLLTEAMDEYGDYIVQFLYTYVRNWQTAEDLTQEVFIRYYRSLAKFRKESTVKTYLYRIAVNVAHDYLMSWKHTKVVVVDFFQKQLKAETTPEQEVLLQDEQQQLIQGIERLPTKYKEVLVLYHFVECSLQEISQMLSVPLNTVKTRLRRARKKLGSFLIEGGTVDE